MESKEQVDSCRDGARVSERRSQRAAFLTAGVLVSGLPSLPDLIVLGGSRFLIVDHPLGGLFLIGWTALPFLIVGCFCPLDKPKRALVAGVGLSGLYWCVYAFSLLSAHNSKDYQGADIGMACIGCMLPVVVTVAMLLVGKPVRA